ncbi:uncharacterized protein LOC125720285 [Brienomyrus brachyistius]|uniref:uncharacterized protein LOC125720285 n=1 Tax=Brienomyrus brachyistius TaxID=42636 RepID=UPI0020B2C8B6|nr:uncharacterized protein LOC125720285 [Brienomyrus brachyistius]
MSLKCSRKFEAGYLLILLMMPGLLGQEGKTVTITERLGNKVTLHTGVTGLQNDSFIVWTFGTSSPPPTIAKSANGKIESNMSERFRGRLQLDPQTGSLSITNISTSDSGIYQLQIIKDHILKKEFDLNIYNPVNRPHITSLQASSRSSVRPSASGSCWVLCSVENGRDVTLSWYRGTETLNQTSSPELSTSLSLPLEIWEDSPAYSCVATNPVSEEAAEGNIKQLCAELECGVKLTAHAWLLTYCAISTEQCIMSLKCSRTFEVGYLLILLIPGLLGQEGRTVTIRGRLENSVTLHSDFTDSFIANASIIVWTYNTATKIAKSVYGRIETNISERFRGRLQLDPQTGSLSITNISTSDAGIYQLQIINGQVLKREFNLEIYYPVNRPHITSLQASSPSSVRPSASRSCWVLCSVENGRDVTLSWYRGTETLNQTSSPDLSTSLSLSLEIWEDSPAYSCVATNPVSEEAAEGNIKQLCAELGPSPMPRMYIIPAIPAVLIPTAVMLMIGLICLTYNTKKCREVKASDGPPDSTLSVGVYIPAPVNPRCSLKQHPGCMRTAAARDGDSVTFTSVCLQKYSSIPRSMWKQDRSRNYITTSNKIRLLGQEGKTVTITERLGNKVTLHTGVTGLQNDSFIVWTFGTSSPPPTIAKSVNGKIESNMSERFRGRLQLDPQTGSLSITNISTSDAGIYQLQIIKDHILKKEFDLNIYNPVNRPHITSLQASSRSSVRPSASGSCWVLCYVENGRDVTLSWYRGTERLNQTISPDHSTSLSLPLEVWEDSPAYSCVATNPVSEEAAEGNIKQLCAELGPPQMPRMYIVPAVLIPTAVILMVIGFISVKYKTRKCTEVKETENPSNAVSDQVTYADINTERTNTQPSEESSTEVECRTMYAAVR